MAAAENALLEVQVSPDWAPAVERWQSVDVVVEGEWTACEVVSINRAVAQGAGMLPVFIGCPTAGNQPIPGTFADVVMRHGEGRQALVIPESALLERYGTYEVAVQTGGEQFFLRPIQLGERGAGEVEVLSGLDAGDLVVTDGAYTVRMISMKGSTPAHGHTH
jgi:multidrug efflux pump subunit AcrA (membrane-fusion protein)